MLITKEDIRQINKNDITLSKIIQTIRYLKTGNGTKYKFLYINEDAWTTDGGKVYYYDLLLVPKEMREDYIVKYYLEGFVSRDKLHKKIMENYLGISRNYIVKVLKKIEAE